MPKVPTKIVLATVIILASVAWLAITGVRENKSYYVTITELQGMGGKAYTRHLRVAGNVAPGSIHRAGSGANFTLLEQGKTLNVVYQGSEPPPDTFKDDAQALAIGTYGRDGVFHATQLQAKCASKYAPAPGSRPVKHLLEPPSQLRSPLVSVDSLLQKHSRSKHQEMARWATSHGSCI